MSKSFNEKIISGKSHPTSACLCDQHVFTLWTCYLKEKYQRQYQYATAMMLNEEKMGWHSVRVTILNHLHVIMFGKE